MRHRRRWVQLRLAVVSVAAIGGIFLLWQLLGVHFINQDLRNRAKVVYEKSYKDQDWSTDFPIQRRINFVHGSRVVDIPHYRPNKDGMFNCMLSGQEVPFERVNDDYCDCPLDGSDEPGTSACSHLESRFYCTFHQRAGKGDVWIPSGRVNDGICDCCDGSDENRNVTFVERLRLSDADQKKFGVYHTPCSFSCF